MSFYETRELHVKEAFRTHWYQGSYEDVRLTEARIMS